MKERITEKEIHFVFEITVILKGLHALLEVLGGLLFLLIPTATISSFVNSIISDELVEDSKDIIATYLSKTASSLSVSGQHFVALYLLSHGVIKLFAIAGLLKKKLWAYPTSIAVFIAFIMYQLYRYTHTHSVWLIVLSIFDLILILLTIHEYRYIKSHIHR